MIFHAALFVMFQVVDGLQMFVGQAVRQFELFTGQPAPAELMQAILVKALGEAAVMPPSAQPTQRA